MHYHGGYTAQNRALRTYLERWGKSAMIDKQQQCSSHSSRSSSGSGGGMSIKMRRPRYMGIYLKNLSSTRTWCHMGTVSHEEWNVT